MNKLSTIWLLIFFWAITACDQSSVQESAGGQRLATGQVLDYFDMVDMDGGQYDSETFKKTPYTLVIVFPRPCAPCSPGMRIWAQVARLTCNAFQKFGVILDDPVEAQSLTDKKLDLQVVLPVDATTFSRRFRLTGNEAQTILLKHAEIIFFHSGELTPAIYTQLMRTIKKLEKSLN